MEPKIDGSLGKEFRENGYAVIPGFLSRQEVTELKEATRRVVEKYCKDMPPITFSAKEESLHARNTYFAESGDKIRGFYEEKALDEEGHLLTGDTEKALNKVAHALHKFEPVFNSITMGSKVLKVLETVTEMKEPTVIQSMVIFKNPKVGGYVKKHQDSTYMYCEPPSGTLLGFWIALDDATLENGCLKFVPGSHKVGKVYQRSVRNPDKTSGQLYTYLGERVPESFQEKLVPAPCNAGDLVLIDGLVIHQSEPNTSDKPRWAYTFHVLDSSANYSQENWLQPTAENTFLPFSQIK